MFSLVLSLSRACCVAAAVLSSRPPLTLKVYSPQSAIRNNAIWPFVVICCHRRCRTMSHGWGHNVRRQHLALQNAKCYSPKTAEKIWREKKKFGNEAQRYRFAWFAPNANVYFLVENPAKIECTRMVLVCVSLSFGARVFKGQRLERHYVTSVDAIHWF